MNYEIIKDDYPLAEGTHQGDNTSDYLFVKNANFDVYLSLGLDCYNITKGINKPIIEIIKNNVQAGVLIELCTEDDKVLTTEDDETLTGESSYITWDKGDVYEIYCTSKKDQNLSKYAISKIYGEKLTKYYKNDPSDIPGDTFGPGQPYGH